MWNVAEQRSSIAEALALDAALLESAERGEGPSAVFRCWELDGAAAIVGRSSVMEEEVDVEACRHGGVTLARRDSGGCAVVGGPGCLMYSVLVGYTEHPELRALDRAHALVLERTRDALAGYVDGIERRGTSDLAIGERKFSGNSLRCRRDHLLYHGTILYDFPLELVSACLRMPKRQPDYRKSRGHGEFLMNLPMDRETIIAALTSAWGADRELRSLPKARAEQLRRERFADEGWTHRR